MSTCKAKTFTIFLLVLVVLSHQSGSAKQRDGWEYFLSNEYNKAIEAFQAQLSARETPESLYGLALACLRYAQLNAKLYRQTLLLESRYYKLLLALEGEGVKHSNYTLYYLGVNQLRLGRVDQAAANLSSVIESAKVNSAYIAYAKLSLGECYLRQGEVGKAKKLWKAVEKVAISDPLLCSEIAALYAEYSIETPQVLERCNEYAETKRPPEQASRFWHNLGWVYYKSGDVQKAFGFFSKGDMRVPDLIDNVYEEKEVKFYVPIYFKRRSDAYFAGCALILEELSQQKEIRFKRKPLSRRKDYKRDVLYCLALCYLELGRPGDAIETLEKRSGDIHAHILLGRAYYENGQRDEAEAQWNKVKDGLTSNVAALVDLVYTYARLGIRSEVVRETLKSLGRENLSGIHFPPYDAVPMSEKHRRVGVAYMNIGEIKEALESLENGHNKMGKNTVSNLRKGNEPLLLMDLALAFYLKGYNFYSQPTETYMVMQEYYPGMKQLHNAMQGIYALWPHIGDKVKDQLICEKYSLLFG